jgi:hypothetical protein
MPQAGEVEIAVLTPETLPKQGRHPGTGISIVPDVKRGGWIVLWSVAAVVLGAALNWGAVELRHHVVFGTVFDESDLSVTVRRGDRFSLVVPDMGGSVGDSWSATVIPAAVLTAVEDREVMSSPVDRIFGPAAGGGAGHRYFIHVASQQGMATVKLSNCFQGCHEPSPYSRDVVWTVTVR